MIKKQDILRLLSGTLGIAVLVGVACSIYLIPVWLGKIFGALMVIAVLIAFAYALGDFIGWVFFDGKF
jgi:hypothetical protein